ncbi:hypothetical protein HN51_035374, partial [Arachis hypogaea]
RKETLQGGSNSRQGSTLGGRCSSKQVVRMLMSPRGQKSPTAAFLVAELLEGVAMKVSREDVSPRRQHAAALGVTLVDVGPYLLVAATAFPAALTPSTNATGEDGNPACYAALQVDIWSGGESQR